MTTNDIKKTFGENTEKLEKKTKEFIDKTSPYYSNLEPHQRGILIIVLLLALIFFIYWLTKKEPRELTEMERKQIEKATSNKKKTKHTEQSLLLLLLLGGGYYFFFHLPNKRKKIKEEIKTLLENNSNINLISQINLFANQMKKTIKEKIDDLERNNLTSKQKRETAIIELSDYCQLEELELPNFKKIIKDYSKKIKQEPVDNISSLQKEANELIVEERVKKQAKMTEIMKREPEHFNIAASYKIKFPPSLWNNLTNKQKTHKKSEELVLIRGERDPDTKLDNNALFYGAPRTGKSVMSEKLAYEADCYPLVVIQGSSLTPKDLDYKSGIDPLGKFIFTLCDIDHTLVDDFGFEREENGEVRYILFVDEANQITTSTLISRSTELTFLKECMGSDTRINESKNLWIMATNHLDQVNPAVYQPGRLRDFMRYADDAGITEKEEKNNRENDNEHFQGKFEPPRKPKIEEVVEKTANQISKSIDVRLKELIETAEEIRNQALTARNTCTSTIEDSLEQIRLVITQMK
ncbi:9038_t:CDS:2 [Funneliformis geosporum]|uniref:9038_t:CDS:1 n=1 Tax=Funneliformis geosporum TaxID=1117311 RepID=A0A9W4WX24_9GLOM|nr:9038_t:CDS:2 [Funneliformis geosporum]